MEERFLLALERAASENRNGETVIARKQPNST